MNSFTCTVCNDSGYVLDINIYPPRYQSCHCEKGQRLDSFEIKQKANLVSERSKAERAVDAAFERRDQ